MKFEYAPSWIALLSFMPLQATALERDVDEELFVVEKQPSYALQGSESLKMDLDFLENPGSIAIIGEQVINEQRASLLSDVLKNDASVTTGATSTNRERFLVRGFALDSGSGYLRDGHIHWSHYRQPVELLERVEIVKGSNGLLYGKSAPGGLVNMVAKKPTEETRLSLSQDIGSHNAFRTVGDLGGSLTDGVRYRVILSHQNHDNWRRYADGGDANTSRFVGGLFLDFDLAENLLLSLHYDQTDERGKLDGGAALIDGEVIGRDVIWDTKWSETDNNIQNLGFNLSYGFDENWTLTLGYSKQWYDRRRTESFPDKPGFDKTTGDYAVSAYDRKDDWRFDNAYMDLVGNFEAAGLEHQLLIGGNWLGYYYRQDNVYLRNVGIANLYSGQSMARPADLDYRTRPAARHRDPTEKDSYGIYLQDQIAFSEDWQLVAGLRYDAFKEGDVTENTVVPKIGLVYHPAPNGSLYLTYSESFEPQSPVSTPQDANFGKSLKPVRGKLYELGTKWEFMDSRLQINAALFDIRMVNKIIVNELPFDAETGVDQETTQAGLQEHIGFELGAIGQVAERFFLQWSMMYLDAELKKDQNFSGNTPMDVPEFTTSLWARYSLETGTDINLGVTYVGSRYADNANRVDKDGFWRVDAGLAHAFEIGTHSLGFRMYVENLFDQDYLNGGGPTSLTIGAPRTVTATLQYQY